MVYGVRPPVVKLSVMVVFVRHSFVIMMSVSSV